ncbi:deoxyribonuclease NucA/NucB-domain-containing protein [Penicillium pulvis]|uniref:deoxyribonuclease NucA/NucB-domain-containing protein n=1 Tax=Penicillium pulvis TaxID=1562058 RepID=UPI002546767D|nr:deoxyribonuclease NucA/NucB-domain-containing protein [Penicillium pulvis]KAJ5792595.1 deoxyribonuclease NucA/NucB-domain-containing protein [Penicillium pulvis]
MRALTLIVFVPFTLGQFDILHLDRINHPGPCNNDCYAAYVAKKPIVWKNCLPQGKMLVLTSVVRPSTTMGPMASPTPANARLSSDENTCDEYPYASTVEGGSGSVLLCTSDDENSAEGSDLIAFCNSVCGFEPSTFEVTFGTPGGGSTPYCLDGGGANDGYQYQCQGNGTYQLYIRGGRIPGLSSSNHRQRQLQTQTLPTKADGGYVSLTQLTTSLLISVASSSGGDGSRTMLSTRDQTSSYQNATFHTVRNGIVIKHRAVKELLGSEKSPELQHPALRASIRIVGSHILDR